MMETKKKFAEPVCEIVHFDVEDVVATSIIRSGWDTDAFAFDEESQ